MGGYTELSGLGAAGHLHGLCVQKGWQVQESPQVGFLHPSPFPSPSAFGGRHLWPFLVFLLTRYPPFQPFVHQGCKTI